MNNPMQGFLMGAVHALGRISFERDLNPFPQGGAFGTDMQNDRHAMPCMHRMPRVHHHCVCHRGTLKFIEFLEIQNPKEHLISQAKST
mmetsp:Transcript_19478/g.32123  ORF Transcript_19478/g.32123 Transcript_19478/m.32123 type:complete len:88 (+) Transcript_19478:728-991(+)